MDVSRTAAAQLYRDLYESGSRQLRKGMKEYALERRAVLRRIGLRPYTPVRTAFGGFALLALGAAAGAAAAWLLAPAQVKEQLQKARSRSLEFLQPTGETPREAPHPVS